MSSPAKAVKPPICDDCKAFLIELLDKRISRILEVGRANLAEGQDECDSDIGQSQCFHLMEIQRIIEGITTCGVYDDYGKPPTITGPLFKANEGPTA
jgi:hypothetical protein